MHKNALSARFLFLLCCSTLLSGTPSVAAEIYRWISPHGVVTFSDTPLVGKRLGKLERLREIAGVPVGERVEPVTTESVIAPASAATEAGGEGAVAEQPSDPAAQAAPGTAEGEGEEREVEGVTLPSTRVPVYLSQGLAPGAPGAQVRLSQAYLSETVLREMDLTGADFGGANFVEATLQGAVLDEGNFYGAFLVNADLGGMSAQDADLRHAKFQGANLRAVDFRSSDLRGAIFAGANVQGADFSAADLSGADLRGVVGLTAGQLATALLDEETQLPEVFASPAQPSVPLVLTNLPSFAGHRRVLSTYLPMSYQGE